MTEKTELPKTFDPAAIEAKWYPHWEGTNAFRPERAVQNIPLPLRAQVTALG